MNLPLSETDQIGQMEKNLKGWKTRTGKVLHRQITDLPTKDVFAPNKHGQKKNHNPPLKTWQITATSNLVHSMMKTKRNVCDLSLSSSLS